MQSVRVCRTNVLLRENLFEEGARREPGKRLQLLHGAEGMQV